MLDNVASLRADLKKLGYNSRQVSVKSTYPGYSQSITMTVHDLKVDIDKLEKLRTKYRCVDYDERTGEILAGGNTYVNISLNPKLYEAGLLKYEEEALYVYNLLANIKSIETYKTFKGATLKLVPMCQSYEGWPYVEIKSPRIDAYRNAHIANTPHDIARALFMFYTFQEFKKF